MSAVYIETFGCQMNVADSDAITALLNQRGYIETMNPQEADLIVVNTCSVRQRAENRARIRIGELARQKNKHQRLWVIGCMAQRVGETLQKEITNIDRVIGAERLATIERDIDSFLDLQGRSYGQKQVHAGGISAFLPIMRGCNNFCAYCIVPHVRGRESSLAAGKLFEQANEMVDQGVKEITLLGQNVNSYHDGELDFADLIDRLHTINNLERIRFTTSHPKDISDKLIRTMADLPKVCKHIHLPVQSGSTAVLARMNRKYTRQHYLERIDTINKYIPDMDITTDVMVGFPSETDDDYLQTLSLFEQVRYTAAFMFAFSIRPGTAAATMENQVPESVKKERLKQLVDIQTQITLQHYNGMVGKNAQVLFTNRQDRKGTSWMGQDYGCKRVLMSCPDELAGMILKVRIAQSTGMTLIAERLEQ